MEVCSSAWPGTALAPTAPLTDVAAGAPAIHLTRRVTPDELAGYARRLLALLGGTRDGKAGSPFERVWEVRIRQKAFWLACDEAGVSLEARGPGATPLVPVLHQWLLRYRERGRPSDAR